MTCLSTRSLVSLALAFLVPVSFVSAKEAGGRSDVHAAAAAAAPPRPVPALAASETNAPVAMPPAAPDRSYVLGPEDQLSIHVLDLDEISDKPVRIDPNGYLELPLIGRVHASGLTIEGLRDALVQQASKYIQSPQITINVLEYRSQPVSVLGAVNSPGLHQLQGPKKLLDVISLAGGFRQDAGATLTITRSLRSGVLPLPDARLDATGTYSVAEVRLDTLLGGHDPAKNIEVRANDVISVGRTQLVYVVGEVKKAGGFSLNSEDSMTLLRALSLAEGPTRDAAPKKARILRAVEGKSTNHQEEPIDISLVLAGKAPDPVLHPNDILFIPNNVPASAMKRAIEAALQMGTAAMIYR
jgi:polysaccharide biosynthesis/export protein